ncbi:MAG: hypothetical protein CVU54_12505 [Deltaproteobacteria bacterium HGW-Deltaproteobacteria-12]|jgi:hypothetical protein|nr:MAG: hypothetical protein CVU54_12505 [Deltaproteobacteria bacterium HGW-Deltaproteobacteria-12]
MKNELIKSVYDLKDQSENYNRRDFLKKAGMAGLALAGLGSLGGCAHVDRTNYDYNAIAKRYESNPIQINSIDDFALSEEELGWMRSCEGFEKVRIPFSKENPLKGKSNEYPLQERKGDTPLCEEWLLAENVGKNSAPWYTIKIFARKFKSEEDYLKMIEKIKKMPFLELEHLERQLVYGLESYATKTRRKITFNIFSKSPFLVEFTSEGRDSNRTMEHAARTKLYQEKRGLNFINGNFDYSNLSSNFKEWTPGEHFMNKLVR